MLDKQVFESLLVELTTYYKRPVTPFVQALWYEYLSDHLSTNEFTQCVNQALLTAKSMPTPEHLVDLKRALSPPCATANTLSLIEWDVCVKAAPRPARRALIEGLSPQGYFALRLVGGLDKLGAATEDELLSYRRQFLSIWEVMRANPCPKTRLVENAEQADLDAMQLMKLSLNRNGKVQQ